MPLVRAVPPPALVLGTHGDPMPTAYFGLRVDAAVNLAEAREYAGLTPAERCRKALGEQRALLASLLDPSLPLALDVRTAVRPTLGELDVSLLGRTWAPDARVAADRAEVLAERCRAALPRHVTTSAIDDSEELAQLLWPFGSANDVDAFAVTRREITGQPMRPDAKVAYYFSVLPFNWTETDWTGLYATLASCPSPLVLSVALRAVALPPSFRRRLDAMAAAYARLASEDSAAAGLYYGKHKLPPEPFAVHAQKVFADYGRRYAERAYAIRTAILSAGPAPPRRPRGGGRRDLAAGHERRRLPDPGVGDRRVRAAAGAQRLRARARALERRDDRRLPAGRSARDLGAPRPALPRPARPVRSGRRDGCELRVPPSDRGQRHPAGPQGQLAARTCS